jgi:deoxyadenosine/deoxycytidine kinase
MDKDDEEYNAKQSKILDDWLKTIPKKKKREEHLIVLDEKILEDNRKRDVTAFEEKLKTHDPKYYEEFMNNLEELRKELDKDPDFLHKLIRDELTPVKITYDFTFENTDS